MIRVKTAAVKQEPARAKEKPSVPELKAMIEKPKKPSKKSGSSTLVTFRLPNDLYEKLKTGPGWQTRVIEILRRNFA